VRLLWGTVRNLASTLGLFSDGSDGIKDRCLLYRGLDAHGPYYDRVTLLLDPVQEQYSVQGRQMISDPNVELHGEFDGTTMCLGCELGHCVGEDQRGDARRH
jgi:hypothetical protein